MVLPIKFYVIAASLGTIVYLSILLRSEIAATSRTICALPPTRKFALAVMLLIAVAFGGTKTNQVDQTSGTNDVPLASSPRRLSPPRPPATPDADGREWLCFAVVTNVETDFAMPAGATMATSWFLRGAFEDVVRLGGLWATPSGRLRKSLADASNDIVAVDAPMSAAPRLSRFWTASGADGSRRFTWENFCLNRSTNALVSAQVEFLANGELVTRSNNVETAYGRHGPDPSLPPGADESAYFWIELSATQTTHVVFTGDAPSNLADPLFVLRAGETAYVKLLIGKRYDVACSAPVTVTARQSDDIVVTGDDDDPRRFSVVWPLTLSTEPPSAPLRLMAPPSSPSQGDGGFTLYPVPNWILGLVCWTNTCCTLEEIGLYTYRCEDGCACNGCRLAGTYDYEGYSLPFGGIGCGCVHENREPTLYGVSATSVGFKGGAPGLLGASIREGEVGLLVTGRLRLEVLGATDCIRLWEDAEMTVPATTFEWDCDGFAGCSYYIEWLAASRSPNDIRFRLTWTPDDGEARVAEAHSTCVEVTGISVTARREDGTPLSSGSPTPAFFPAGSNYTFDVTHSPNPDPHFSVLFRDVVTDDFGVTNFSVNMELTVTPSGADVSGAKWFLLDNLSTNGLAATGPRTGALANPKSGGIWRIGGHFPGSPTNSCVVVLPLAGAAVEDILQEDLARADEFAAFVRSRLDEKQINTIQFGLYFFWDAGRGDYLGRPDNMDSPTVWCYNQVVTSGRQFGKGAVATLFGLPVRISKLSNLLAAYTCDRLGVYQELQKLSQWIGTRNDDSSLISWDCGTALAHGSNYVHSVSNMVRQCWGSSDEKAAKLWPNANAVDNQAAAVYYGDVERFFYSPGMLYFIQQLSTRNDQ